MYLFYFDPDNAPYACAYRTYGWLRPWHPLQFIPQETPRLTGLARASGWCDWCREKVGRLSLFFSDGAYSRATLWTYQFVCRARVINWLQCETFWTRNQARGAAYRGTLSHPSLLPPNLVVLCELGIRLFSSFFCSWRVSVKCSTNWLGSPHVCGTFGEHFTWHTRPHSAVTKEKLPYSLELAPLINFRTLNAALIGVNTLH